MIYFGHRMALLRVWEGSKAARIFPVCWGLVLAFGWDTLTSLPVVSYASRAALIASSFEMGSQWLGARMGLTSGSRSSPMSGPRKPRPWKSEVQFLKMNSRVQVLSVGEWTCSSVVELAKSLFVCYAASNDITWFSTKARVKGGSSGFRWPSLWNMSSRKRLKDSLRPKRNLPPNKFFRIYSVKCWWRFEMLPKKQFNDAVLSTRDWLAVKTGPDTTLSSILFYFLTKNKHAQPWWTNLFTPTSTRW